MASKLFTLLALAVSLALALDASGASMHLNGLYYFVSPFSEHKVCDGPVTTKALTNSFGLMPITVVSDHVASPSVLMQMFHNWTALDDVWQPGFLQTVFLAGSDKNTMSNISFHADIDSDIQPLSKSSNIPSGPYFLNAYTGQIHQAFRLYDDFSGSFTQSVLQRPDGGFQTMSAHVPSAASITIAVPSRLYFKKTDEKPLAGVRVGVKDMFTLKGQKRSCGNRAFYGLYPPANATSKAIQNLIDAGAIVVGLQKLSQFANGEVPTADWVDYHAPFNPRGDGYQDTSTSSAGAGASIGSYDWLDLAVGSDTGGSIRGPAGNQGVFGNRPTRGLVTLDDVMPMSPKLDTTGLLARDPHIWERGIAALYKSNFTSVGDKSPNYPKKLYLLGLPKDNTTRSRIINKFAADLANFLKISTTVLDLEREWATSGPDAAKNTKLSEIFNTTYSTLISKQQTRLLREPFYKDYAAAHDGRLPFVDPVPLARWAYGDAQPESALSDAISNKTMFMDWFNEKVLPVVSDESTCSSGLILRLDGISTFSDRNRYLSPPKPPFGFTNDQVSIFAEVPDSTFPLGQAPVHSSITNHTEFLPVAIGVVAARRCDGLLSRLAKDLVAAGILKEPKVGSGIDGGEILLRRQYF